MEEEPTSSPSNHSGHTEHSLREIENKLMAEVYIDLTLEINHRDKIPSKCKIYRVHGHLRNINDKAYEPEVIAIGPYHHDKENLKMMEDYKKRYFTLIRMRNNKSFGEYYSAIRPLAQEAQTCYADPLSLDETEFIKMLILDGCFIIELARKIDKREYDHFTCMGWMINSLKRDLMLFENQIPFFVLCKLFDLIEGPDQHSSLVGLLTRLFDNYVCPMEEDRENSTGLLTKFFRNICHVKEDRESSKSSPVDGKQRSPDEIKHLLHLVRINFVSSFKLDLVERVKHNGKPWDFIKSASWLSEANVEFKRNKGARSLFDIKFERGNVLLPSLTIEDQTESWLRNLIAYEQYFLDPQSNYFMDRYSCVTDYVLFFDRLINSSGDAEILSRSKIIDNCLGDDDVVAKIFNKLMDSVHFGDNDFIYGEIFNRVNMHCSKPWNGWMAKLRRNYFNSPWAIISIIAAVVLLLLTVAQTVFSGISLK